MPTQRDAFRRKSEFEQGPMSYRDGNFSTTHWSLVLAAGCEDAPKARAALEELCRAYWYPLYAHIRRSGFDADQSSDLTQGFFADILRRDFLHRVGPEKGRFRSFLLKCLNHFLSDEWDRAHAAKRGNGIAPISLDSALAEGHYQNEPIDELTPEIAYERRWAATLLARAERRLGEEYAAAGKTDLYNRLKQFPLAEAGSDSFHDCAAQQGISEGSLKSAVHRLRQRYRELVRAEVAHTVGDTAEVEDEIRHLINVVRT